MSVAITLLRSTRRRRHFSRARLEVLAMRWGMLLFCLAAWAAIVWWAAR